MHFGCNLNLEAISLVEGWDVGTVVGGIEEKAEIKEDTQVVTLPTGREALPFIEPENTGKGIILGLGNHHLLTRLFEHFSYWCLPLGIFPTIHSRKFSFIKTDPKEEDIFNRSKVKEN